MYRYLQPAMVQLNSYISDPARLHLVTNFNRQLEPTRYTIGCQMWTLLLVSMATPQGTRAMMVFGVFVLQKRCLPFYKHVQFILLSRFTTYLGGHDKTKWEIITIGNSTLFYIVNNYVIKKQALVVGKVLVSVRSITVVKQTTSSDLDDFHFVI